MLGILTLYISYADHFSRICKSSNRGDSRSSSTTTQESEQRLEPQRLQLPLHGHQRWTGRQKIIKTKEQKNWEKMKVDDLKDEILAEKDEEGAPMYKPKEL